MSEALEEATAAFQADQGPEDEVQEEWTLTDLATMQFIATSRLYDVMMALLMEADSEKAEHLLGLHAEGSLLMPAPGFNGTFVTSAANSSDGATNTPE